MKKFFLIVLVVFVLFSGCSSSGVLNDLTGKQSKDERRYPLRCNHIIGSGDPKMINYDIKDDFIALYFETTYWPHTDTVTFLSFKGEPVPVVLESEEEISGPKYKKFVLKGDFSELQGKEIITISYDAAGEKKTTKVSCSINELKEWLITVSDCDSFEANSDARNKCLSNARVNEINAK